ncbi:glycosyltransferase family 1 protein [Virgibacillus profundi]|uniref:Glycosyltransferase family 1 protein n=1 Tax=Virgibacillus profundi TaxID=2024555 RepID=A0A2A2IIV5_9BACI|nr:glycosyltransferase family 4 protein [Virgibacillus profundi]PAV31557.1 glycosyltransferase family 1 protein [Virgibacillus profundi]PXY55743.1 glycosyltransferase family 1 protein [Virgibacillus profundi]
MSGRILYCATVDYHFKAFHLPYMKWFKEQGWIVDVAASGEIDLPYTDNKYNIPIQRSPFHSSNLKAYKQLKAIIDQNDYSIIHCHTPLGGVLARLAAREARKNETKVLYTAHGFHFCKGAPLKNWCIYYPIEKYLSRHTDSLITINKEDYKLVVNHRFKAGRIEQVHGVGVDTERFKVIEPTKKLELKKSFGYKADDFLLFYAAEFNKNKNQQFLIQSLALIKDEVPHAKLLLAGEGILLEDCKDLAERLGISHRIEFMGFRKDIDQILPMCDIAVASSFREGLPVNIMEAMACELPVLAVDNRGHRELISNNKNGWLLNEWDTGDFSKKIKVLSESGALRKQFGLKGREMILDKFSINKVMAAKSRIYKSHMEGRGEKIWAVH